MHALTIALEAVTFICLFLGGLGMLFAIVSVIVLLTW